MNTEHYATITIRVYASREDIDGPNELALSDEVYDIKDALDRFLKEEKWLIDRRQASRLNFRVFDDSDDLIEA